MTELLSCLRRLVVDRKGVTAMEYGVIAAAVVVTGLAALPTLGGKIATVIGNVSSSL